MNVLVTGSAGFIGRHVAEHLHAKGHHVLGVDIRKSEQDAWAEMHMNVTEFADVWDEHFDAVVHLAAFGGVARAAREPKFVFDQNVTATSALVQFLKSIHNLKRVILASSFSVYGSHADLASEATETQPLEVYAASKLGQELAFVGSGLPVTTLRFSSVYGRYMRFDDDEATILAKIVGRVMREEVLIINEDGYQTRDFVYVGDVLAAIDALLEKPFDTIPDHERLVNVCTGQAVTLKGAIETIGQILGKRPRIEYTGKARPGDMRQCVGGSTARLQNLIGRPPTPFAKGAIDAFAGLT